VLLVDIGGRLTSREAVVLPRRRRARRLSRGSGCHPSLLNHTRYWHCVRAVKPTFHRRSRRRHPHDRRRRWIRCPAVAQRSAAGICAAACTFHFSPDLLHVADPLDIS